jgi:hypothetical protein
MYDMSIETPAKTEVLIARKQVWHRRLWVRIVLVLLLAYFIGLMSWWWPRRTMVAVWWVGGVSIADGRKEHAIRVATLLASSGCTSVGSKLVSSRLSWLDTDREITGVGLLESPVDDGWLVQLKHFPKLQSLELHDRQLGPGLECLRDSLNLKTIKVTAASDRRLVELRRLPQLVDLTLYKPLFGDLRLEAFSSLVNLKHLSLEQSRETGIFFKQLPVLPELQSVSIWASRGYVNDELAELVRQPNLKLLTIGHSLRLNDAGLLQLSKLKNLERLEIQQPWGEVTMTGLASLQELKKLKSLIVDNRSLKSEKMMLLYSLLPGASIFAF